jgi:hypothetical protein
MAAPVADQTALMKDVLEALKVLTANQTQLAANVDAINGRVNILAGIKEVEHAATASTSSKNEPSASTTAHIDSKDDHDAGVPESPTVAAAEVDHATMPSTASPSNTHHTPTSRIILTWVKTQPYPSLHPDTVPLKPPYTCA